MPPRDSEVNDRTRAVLEHATTLWPAHWGSGYPNVERRVAAKGGVTNGHDSATDPGTPPPTLPIPHRTPTC
ncbi:hypothetical protein J6590_000063 [Homalodisca vitripennis]|nr:hypothetical protein J6590_000063 [Homalodisca vitripennis]